MEPESGVAARAHRAMQLSLAVAVLMLAGKTAAWALTGSTAILSDAAESVIHLVAVAFASFSLRLSSRPADQRFLYGYERISFFSAGFEGAMIILAAVAIIAAAIQKWLAGLVFENLGLGTLMIAGAASMNLALGWHLVRTGRVAHSMILIANGKHVLTDCWTSFGVVAGLAAAQLTAWKPFDPLVAIAVALNILWSGGRLVVNSIRGLMDYSDPATAQQLREKLDSLCASLDLQYHAVRFRNTGYRLLVDIHLLFPFAYALGEAHRRATELEDRLPEALGVPTEVTTHLEAFEDHAEIHRAGHRAEH